MAKTCVLANVIDSVTITTEDKESLRIKYVTFVAVEDLIKKGIVNDAILDRHAKAYDEFNSEWNNILKKYFPNKDYNPLVGGNYSWNCDFATCIVTITVPC